MVIEQLIDLGRFREKSRLSHGMVADDGNTWPSILLSQLIWCSRKQILSISMLVKSTYTRCDALFNYKGREVPTMIIFDQVYTQVLNKIIKDA